MDIFFYNLFLRLYGAAILIVSLFNKKAKLWVKGREGVFDKLRNAIHGEQAVIWMHCASLGEFEQGRPVLERLKEQYPRHKFLLTFFSPSGYEVRKNYDGVDWVFYLPLDLKANAEKFLDIVKPKLVIFVKYEYWYYYLHEIHKRNIPAILISAIFRENAVFFKWYGSVHRKMLTYFDHIFVQTPDSYERVSQLISPSDITLAGDTRFDRVTSIADGFEPLPVIEKFVEGKGKVVVAGSTWPEDEVMLKKLLVADSNISLIIAPHEITPTHISSVKHTFEGAALYSDLKEQINGDTTALVLIIDNIGMLSKLYKYSNISYIGGGFNKSGIHNTLEAAVYGRPVIFGPNYSKFAEAISLIKNKAGLSYKTETELVEISRELLSNEARLIEYSANAKNFVAENTGATARILAWLKQTSF